MRSPRPPEDAQWLRKLIAASDKALGQLHVDIGTAGLHTDITLLRNDLQARLQKLDAESAA